MSLNKANSVGRSGPDGQRHLNAGIRVLQVKYLATAMRRQHGYSRAPTIQLGEEGLGHQGGLGNVRPRETARGSEHRDVVHKVLMEVLSLVGELSPCEM